MRIKTHRNAGGERHTSVVSLVSGKGGVGKTSICLAVGRVLAHFGYSVLLVDFDLATHGMTYFFTENIKKVYVGIEELSLQDKGRGEDASIVGIEDRFDVVPSKTNFSSGVAQVDEDKATSILQGLIAAKSSTYDYILIDCQAGVTKTVQGAVRLSDKVIVVAEADPVSTWAVKLLEYEIGKLLPAETFGLINKLFWEDEAAYNAIKDFLRIMKYLPPLPFDREVIRSFLRKLIPADINNPSAFVLAIVASLEDLFPEMHDKIKDYLQSRSDKQITEAEERLQALDDEEKSLRTQLTELRVEDKMQGERFIRRTFTLGGAMVFSVLAMLILLYMGFLERSIFIPIIITVVATAIFASIQLYLAQRRRRTEMSLHLEERTEQISNRIAEIRREKEKYKTLVMK